MTDTIEFGTTYELEFARKQVCFVCNTPVYEPCDCPNRNQGENINFALNPEDLPPRDAPLEAQIVFFDKLLRHGQRTRTAVEFARFYQDQVVKTNALTHMRDPAVRASFDAIWDRFAEHPEFPRILAQIDVKPNIPQDCPEEEAQMRFIVFLATIRTLGRELFDLFFAGHWYAISPFHVHLLGAALGTVGPSPHDPSSAPLRCCYNLMDFTETILRLMAPRQRVFSLVSPAKIPWMQQLHAYRGARGNPGTSSTSNAGGKAAATAAEEEEDNDDDDELPALAPISAEDQHLSQGLGKANLSESDDAPATEETTAPPAPPSADE